MEIRHEHQKVIALLKANLWSPLTLVLSLGIGGGKAGLGLW